MNVTLRQIVITYHLFILSIFYNTAVSYFLMCVIVQIEELNIVKHIDDTARKRGLYFNDPAKITDPSNDNYSKLYMRWTLLCINTLRIRNYVQYTKGVHLMEGSSEYNVLINKIVQVLKSWSKD